MALLTKSSTFSYGRKRILVFQGTSDFHGFELFTPIKRRCDIQKLHTKSNSSSPLEDLPLDILIKVICGVDHDDLKQLFHVSETVRNATKIAKQTHFAYNTPSKFTTLRNSIDLLNNLTDFEAPNAPKQLRKMNRTRICRKNLKNLSAAFFADEYDDHPHRGPRRSLFTEANN